MTSTGPAPNLRRPLPPTHRLVVLFGPDEKARGRTVLLDEGDVVVGRLGAASGPLALADPGVSGRHATISRDGKGQAWVQDEKSRNGTFVDGEPVVRAPLDDGSIIRAGGSLLLYQVLAIQDPAALDPDEEPPLLGTSVAMQVLRGQLALAASHPAPVLLLGESGAGKEVCAAELHRKRGRGPFLSLNCSALPADLAESELFGHVAGAFTGAVQKREGLFVAADGGTLFLDEIGEMPLALQPKLLRALATGEVRPVGATRPMAVDVRIVAATNRDLAAAVDRGTFRGDLYARLAAWVIEVPPLRARREDILRLAEHFLRRAGGADTEIAVDAAERLLLDPWRFNVRELEQRVSVARALARGGRVLAIEHVSPVSTASRPPQRLEAPTERELLGALERAGGDDAAAAESLGTDRATLRRWLHQRGIASVAPTRPAADELRAALERFHGNVAHVADFLGKERRQVYRWIELYGLKLEEFRPR